MLKKYVVNSLRITGLLAVANEINFVLHQLLTFLDNRLVVRANPELVFPPARLAFEEFGHVSHREYLNSGKSFAILLSGLVAEYTKDKKSLSILEWGCGTARILRHLDNAFDNVDITAYGVDVDMDAIAWCKEYIHSIHFSENSPVPPLHFSDNSLDVVYNYSVFTHLTLEKQVLWLNEFARILKPGGLLIGTTHGNRYRNILLGSELASFDAGDLVIRSGYREGRKYFMTFHPQQLMSSMFHEAGFKLDEDQPVKRASVPQDIWVVEKIGQ